MQQPASLLSGEVSTSTREEGGVAWSVLLWPVYTPSVVLADCSILLGELPGCRTLKFAVWFKRFPNTSQEVR